MKILHPPVFLFQMGKVGSTTLLSTLTPLYNGVVVQSHTFDGMLLEHRQLLTWHQRLHLPVLVICPVRDPLSRNISAFFQNFTRDTGQQFSAREWSVTELQDLFLQHYPHNTCLEWFDRRLRPIFGFDVLAESFPVERKWNVYKKGPVKLLVYRADLDRSEQLNVISQFIGYRVDNWCYSNVAEDKNYGDLYKQFCATATLPDIYLNIMSNSSFCRKFWSSSEIDEMVNRWKKN